MTVGSRTNGTYNYSTQRYYWPNSYPSMVPSGTYFAGVIQVKNWSGGNASVLRRPRLSGRVHSTILNGSPYRFKVFPTLARENIKKPNAYTMDCVKLIDVARDHILRDYYVSNNQPVGSYYRYLNCSKSYGLNQPHLHHVTPVFSANDQIALVNRLRDKVRGSDFNFAVFLGESHQVLSMIADRALKLAKAYRYARKGDFGAAAASLALTKGSSVKKTTANNWLELQYGWLPLLKDMKAGAESLSHRLHVPFRQRVVIRMSRTASGPMHANSSLGWFWNDSRVTAQRQIVAVISEPESLATISGLLDPELVLWELTPFSFVADWVAPIGDYMAARAFASRLAGTFVTTDTVRRHVSNWSPEKPSTTPGAITYAMWDPDKGESRVDDIKVTRVVSSSLFVPAPQVKPLAKVASWRHCANALALLTQAVRLK